jgi:transposase-like protein
MTGLANQDRREMGRRLNNRAENWHLPIRRREQRFRRMKSLQRFAWAGHKGLQATKIVHYRELWERRAC